MSDFEGRKQSHDFDLEKKVVERPSAGRFCILRAEETRQIIASEIYSFDREETETRILIQRRERQSGHVLNESQFEQQKKADKTWSVVGIF